MSSIHDVLRDYLDRGMTMAENFSKLRVHMRYSRSINSLIANDEPSLVMSAYAESEDGTTWTISENASFYGYDVSGFIKSTISDIQEDLNTSVLIQVAPRLSVIVKNHKKLGDFEFQFLNMALPVLFDAFLLGTIKCPPYPGIEGILLLKPKKYQDSMNDINLPHMPSAKMYKEEPAKEPHDYNLFGQQNPASKQTNPHAEMMADSLLRTGISAMQSQAEALKNDVDNKLTPTLEYSPDMETALSIKRLVEERNHERSPFREGDNELQKKIAMNELDDSSLNVLETLPNDETSDLIDAADANAENLNDFFGTDEEEIPEPTTPTPSDKK